MPKSSKLPELLSFVKPPDKNENFSQPPHTMDISQFIQSISHNSKDEDIFLPLNGIYRGKPVWLQHAKLLTNVNVVETVIDIDSVLFNRSNPPITVDLSVVQMPIRTTAIQKDNKVTWSIDGVKTPLFRIPNYQIATFGPNGIFKLHIFFPRLREKHPLSKKWINFIKD